MERHWLSNCALETGVTEIFILLSLIKAVVVVIVVVLSTAAVAVAAAQVMVAAIVDRRFISDFFVLHKSINGLENALQNCSMTRLFEQQLSLLTKHLAYQ